MSVRLRPFSHVPYHSVPGPVSVLLSPCLTPPESGWLCSPAHLPLSCHEELTREGPLKFTQRIFIVCVCLGTILGPREVLAKKVPDVVFFIHWIRNTVAGTMNGGRGRWSGECP